MDVQELCELVRSTDRLIPFGANSKPALSVSAEPNVTRIDMKSMGGIVSYDPTEFLITARAGTKVETIEQALNSQGQYLPFDPIWTQRGTTIGGAVASGLSGPSRVLYGSLRDFMLEVVMVDGLGREVRGGAKVVKNAAGFDFPKLMVGSYGRMGILTEITLKVFPRPVANLTVVWTLSDLPQTTGALFALVALPLQIAAIEIDPPHTLLARLSGPSAALAKMADRADACVGSKGQRIDKAEEESKLWRDCAEMNWLEAGAGLVRVAITAHRMDALAKALQPLESVRKIRFSCAGAVAWLAVDPHQSLEPLHAVLETCGLSAVVVSGNVPELTSLGICRWQSFATRVQKAIDPHGKFIGFTQSGTRIAES